ncbi:NAD(P)/FAD-dependent oxidoreductase [Galbitalea sp. SE-J8]|uniref:dihydrolipoyl dehydrogenase family protein n=1 Tax=Galbitalea sp. SE-J8 TaxID=3054952 RepID=UPI00259D2058|nr:NAD(P)/FAD-dependent oxidoreductase [Galbitalea sp. SE-J8]MDM4762328.1 NAD(P)/FAD-dependent oxidoreductase [Galbitalea sp. SE-J8]
MAGDQHTPAPDYDLIVIGAGPVGENVADYATRRGIRVAIVESELVGGECSYWACMPSKALLRSGHALRAAERLDGARQATTGSLDAPAVLARRNAFASDWKDDGQVEWLSSAGIDLIRGHARITGPGLIEVDGRAYRATAVAVATGSIPVLPDVPGLPAAKPWGTREATSAAAVPPRLLVVGGGVAGTELSDGTIVTSDEILIATGRRPATLDLGVETVGLVPGEWLTVDDTLLVSGTDWLYAVGDVNGRALLTHQGKYQARAAGEAIAARITGAPVHAEPWGDHVATADHAAVPHVVFTDPEVARAGLTEREARARGLAVRVVEYDLGWVSGAKLHADGYEGRAVFIIDEDRQVIVGATFVGQDVAELLHSATIAIVAEVPLARLWHAVPSYPTISEVWLRLLETYGRPTAR